MSTWPYGASSHRIPRGKNEQSGPPRRVLIWEDGSAECRCRLLGEDHRYGLRAVGCPHVMRARRLASDPCRLVVEDLVLAWGVEGAWDDREDWTAFAIQSLQDALRADDDRRRRLAYLEERSARSVDEHAAEAIATFGGP